MQVVRGWIALTDRVSRLVLPDGASGSVLAEQVRAHRCELALGAVPRADDDPVGFAVALDQLVRMGEPPDHWLPELVDAVEQVGRRSASSATWLDAAALDAAARVLLAANERRALDDLTRIAGERPRVTPPSELSHDLLAPWIEARLANGRGELAPAGFPADWLGQSIEAYGLPTAVGSAVSFAVRWHGERPAVLWEQTGDPIELTAPTVAPGWSTGERAGEALWPAPLQPAGGVAGDPHIAGEPGSFS